MQAIYIILSVPLVICLAVVSLYGFQFIGTARPSRTWRTVGTFALYFTGVYIALAAFMILQIKDYIPHAG